ncbi:hypothetical protein TNCT_647331 [Trichonephila clavata]|uniref:Uncharacterized protein n=1 Tax=Trichonephila clavata TaxID=2740835 RepID=A0A8X6EZM5_TRICU|nr:hypothetical protein TNCT_647331 [Trichonephila clavata]
MPKRTLSSPDMNENGFETNRGPNQYPRELLHLNQGRIIENGILPNQYIQDSFPNPPQLPRPMAIRPANLEQDRRQTRSEFRQQSPSQLHLNLPDLSRPSFHDLPQCLPPTLRPHYRVESPDRSPLHPHPLRLAQNRPHSPYGFPLDHQNRLHLYPEIPLESQPPSGLQLGPRTRSQARAQAQSHLQTRSGSGILSLPETQSQSYPPIPLPNQSQFQDNSQSEPVQYPPLEPYPPPEHQLSNFLMPGQVLQCLGARDNSCDDNTENPVYMVRVLPPPPPLIPLDLSVMGSFPPVDPQDPHPWVPRSLENQIQPNIDPLQGDGPRREVWDHRDDNARDAWDHREEVRRGFFQPPREAPVLYRQDLPEGIENLYGDAEIHQNIIAEDPDLSLAAAQNDTQFLVRKLLNKVSDLLSENMALRNELNQRNGDNDGDDDDDDYDEQEDY